MSGNARARSIASGSCGWYCHDFETQAELGELGKALAEFGIARQVWRNDARGEFGDRLAAIPGHAVADAAKPPAADGDLRFQHIAHARTERKIGMADDGLGDPAGAVVARRAHRGDAVDELDLAHRRHLGRAVLAVHCLAFEEHGGHDVVSAADIGEQLGQEVAAAMRRIPEVVVRIDDRQGRLHCCLAQPLRQPRLQVAVVAVRNAAILAPGVTCFNHFHPLA